MKIAAQKINNKGIIFSKQQIQKATEKMIKLHNKALYELYRNCYIYSPSGYDDYDFKLMLKQEFGNEISKYFMDKLRGCISITPDTIDFVLDIYGYDLSEDFKLVLTYYRDILVAKEAFSVFDNLINNIKFQKKSDTVKVTPRLSVTSRVENNGALNLDNPYMLDCIKFDDSIKLVRKNYACVLLKYLCKDLENFEDYVNNNKSIFFLGETFEKDVKYYNLIVSGVVSGNTDYGVSIFNRISDYYEEFTKNSSDCVTCLPFSETIYVEALNESINLMKFYREIEPDLEPVWVTNTEIIYARKVESVKESLVSDFIGTYCIDYARQVELSKVNCLDGFSGEFIRKVDVEYNGYKVIGVPIRLLNENGKYDDYYPICNVYDNNYELLPLIGNEFDLTFSEHKPEFNCSKLMDKYTKIEYNLLVTYLNSLLNIECNTDDKNYNYLNNVEQYEDVDENKLLMIQHEVELLFNSLTY